MSNLRKSTRKKTQPERFDKERKYYDSYFKDYAGPNNTHITGSDALESPVPVNSFEPESNPEHAAMFGIARQKRHRNITLHQESLNNSVTNDTIQQGCNIRGCYSTNVDQVSPTRILEVKSEEKYCDPNNVDTPVMAAIREINGNIGFSKKKGQCLGYNCNKTLTDEDDDHALCNKCWDRTFPRNRRPDTLPVTPPKKEGYSDDVDRQAKLPRHPSKRPRTCLDCVTDLPLNSPYWITRCGYCYYDFKEQEDGAGQIDQPCFTLRQTDDHPEVRIFMIIENIESGEKHKFRYAEALSTSGPDWFTHQRPMVIKCMNIAVSGEALCPGWYVVHQLEMGTERSSFQDPTVYVQSKNLVEDYRPNGVFSDQCEIYQFDGSSFHANNKNNTWFENKCNRLLILKNERISELIYENNVLMNKLGLSLQMTQTAQLLVENYTRKYQVDPTQSMGVIGDHHVLRHRVGAEFLMELQNNTKTNNSGDGDIEFAWECYSLKDAEEIAFNDCRRESDEWQVARVYKVFNWNTLEGIVGSCVRTWYPDIAVGSHVVAPYTDTGQD